VGFFFCGFILPFSHSTAMGCVWSKSQSSSVSIRQELDKLLVNSYETYVELVKELKQMMEYRAETIKEMNSVADKLDRRRRDANIVRLAASTSSVLGAAGVVLAALAPVTGGASAPFGAIMAMMAGAAGSVGTEVTEEVLEKVDLAKVQRTVDREREQGDRVKALWEKFNTNCTNIIDTIELVNPKEPEVKVFKERVLVAAKKTPKSAVSLIAESLQAVYKELTTSNGKSTGEQNAEPTAEKLSSALLCTAKEIVENVDWKSVVAENPFVVTTVATICVWNLTELIEISIDVHDGSLSEVAKDIRDKSSRLQKEYEQWKEDFGDLQ
jgi:hypothetical protein